jgi:hypothetical protein
MSLFPDDAASGRDQRVVGIGNALVSIGGQQDLAGADLRFYLREVVGEPDALGASLLWLRTPAADHEWHLAVVENRGKRTGVEVSPPLALGTISIHPKAKENAE